MHQTHIPYVHPCGTFSSSSSEKSSFTVISDLSFSSAGFIISATHSSNISPYCLVFSTKVKAAFACTCTSISAKNFGGPTLSSQFMKLYLQGYWAALGWKLSLCLIGYSVGHTFLKKE